MSFLDRIAACRAHAPGRYRPFRVEGRLLGRVRADIVPDLLAHDDVFVPLPDPAVDASPGGCGVPSTPTRPGDRAPATDPAKPLTTGASTAPAALGLAPSLDTAERRTAAVDRVVRALADQGVVRWLGSELYPVVTHHGATPAFLLERSALPTLGARAFGVHMNGLVRRADGLHVWIARRARGKTTYPGMLDNMVAGGQPAGLGVRENLVKECGEEAAIPPALAARAVPTGALSYSLDIDRGLRRDTLFVFDLELPADFVPRPVDGEVEAFELWPVDRVAERVRDTADFKFNCNLVIIDLLIRHGWLGPDDPDYHATVTGLHGDGCA